MASYTDEEQRAAVEKCLGETYESTEDITGLPDMAVDRKELIRSTAMTILQNPDAYFYLASLKRDRLYEYVEDFVDTLTEAIDAINDFSRQSPNVSVTPLTKARQKAEQCYQYLNNGVSSSNLVEKAASYLSTFNSKIESALASSGEIRRTKEGAQKYIQEVITALEENVVYILNEVNEIVNASLEQDRLEAAYAEAALEKIIRMLYGEEESFATYSNEQLQAALRDMYLNTKAAEIVLLMRSLFPSASAARFEGTGQPANSSSEPADNVTAASITGTISGPYLIEPADATLDIEVNETATSMTAPVSSRGELVSYHTETYNIVAPTQAWVTGTVAAPNFIFGVLSPFDVVVDGVTYTYIGGGIPAGNYPIAVLIGMLGTNLQDAGGTAITTVVSIVNVGNRIRFQWPTTGAHSIMIGDAGSGGANTVMGYTDFMSSDDTSDPDTQEGLDGTDNIVLSVDEGVNQSVTLTAGAARTAAQIGTDIVTATAGISSGDTGGRVYVRTNTYGDGGRIRVVSGTALEELGFWENQFSQGTHIDTYRVATTFNDTITGALATTSLQELSSGECETIPGVTNQIDLPAGEGANVSSTDCLQIYGEKNKGSYRITGVAGDTLTLSRSVFFDQDVFGNPIVETYRVIRADITITSTKTDALDSQLDVITAPNIYGLPLGEVYGSVSGFDSQSSVEFARVGDTLVYNGNNFTIQVIDDTRLEVTPEIPMNTSAASFSITTADGVDTLAAGTSFEEMKASLETWLQSINGQISVRELNRLFNLAKASPSSANLTALSNSLTAVKAFFYGSSALLSILVSYQCRDLPEIRDLLDTLEQKGEDRAVDKLIDLNFTDMLSTDEPKSYGEAVRVFMRALISQYKTPEAAGELDGFVLEDYDEAEQEWESSEIILGIPRETDVY